MNRTDLAIYTENLVNSIRVRYPDLSDREVEIAANTIIGEVSKHLSGGGDIALITRNQDKTIDLTLIELKVVNRLRGR